MIPTQENGDWMINRDRTMVTTYHLRLNTRWHDGTPLTARDFVFAFSVYIEQGPADSAAEPRAPDAAGRGAR